jgi:hypothetical protein
MAFSTVVNAVGKRRARRARHARSVATTTKNATSGSQFKAPIFSFNSGKQYSSSGINKRRKIEISASHSSSGSIGSTVLSTYSPAQAKKRECAGDESVASKNATSGNKRRKIEISASHSSSSSSSIGSTVLSTCSPAQAKKRECAGDDDKKKSLTEAVGDDDCDDLFYSSGSSDDEEDAIEDPLGLAIIQDRKRHFPIHEMGNNAPPSKRMCRREDEDAKPQAEYQVPAVVVSRLIRKLLITILLIYLLSEYFLSPVSSHF